MRAIDIGSAEEGDDDGVELPANSSLLDSKCHGEAASSTQRLHEREHDNHRYRCAGKFCGFRQIVGLQR